MHRHRQEIFEFFGIYKLLIFLLFSFEIKINYENRNKCDFCKLFYSYLISFFYLMHNKDKDVKQ